MDPGKLITIEGIDGAGKSTLAVGLAQALETRGIAVQLLREPGGVLASERIRDLVVDPKLHVGARAEALLYAAARAQLVDEALRPLLEKGTWVLLDRFVDSSLAYQGGGRRLGIDAVREINEFAIQGLRPDRTLLLAIDPAAGQARSGSEPPAMVCSSAKPVRSASLPNATVCPEIASRCFMRRMTEACGSALATVV